MTKTPETIVAPFSAYHRAKLERLILEWFEYIEMWAIENQSAGEYGRPHGEAMSAGQFQILVAADAYLRATRAPQWQPIETAPKDGTKIDVWADGERLADCCFTNPASIYNVRTGKYEKRSPRFCVFEVCGYDGEMGWEPVTETITHWMPIPKAPTGETK
jgi:hypothetical protein